MGIDIEEDHTDKTTTADNVTDDTIEKNTADEENRRISCGTIFRLISQAFTPDSGQNQVGTFCI